MASRSFKHLFGVGSPNPHIKLMSMGNDDFDDFYDDLYDVGSSHTSHRLLVASGKQSAQHSELSVLQDTHIKPPAGNRMASKSKGLDVTTVLVDAASVRNNVKDNLTECKTLSVSRSASKLGDEKNDTSAKKKGLVLPTFAPIVDKRPYTEKWEAMDRMLDSMLRNTNNTVEDRAKNKEAVANAKVEGVKVRDFAVQPPLGTPTPGRHNSALVSQEYHVEVFPAREKALEFFYMRFLVKNGVHDLSNIYTAADDFDRLYTCGFIKPEYLDHPLLRAVLGHGVYRRLLRSSGRPSSTGKILTPRGPWTFPIDSRCPSKKTIDRYIADNEAERTSSRRKAYHHRIATLKRSVLIKDYVDNHAKRDGSFCLKGTEGINDAQTNKLLDEKDETFIKPKSFLEKTCKLLPHPKDADPIVSQPVPSPIAPDSSQFTSASLSETVNQTSTPARGRSSVSKSQKRARSSSVGKDDLASPSRTRPRLSNETVVPLTTTVSSSAECTLRQPTGEVTVHEPEPELSPSLSPSRGCKRERDNEQEKEGLGVTSPRKKLKVASNIVTTVTGHSSALLTQCLLSRRIRRTPRMGADRVRYAFFKLPKDSMSRGLSLCPQKTPDVRLAKFGGLFEHGYEFSWPKLWAQFSRKTATASV